MARKMLFPFLMIITILAAACTAAPASTSIPPVIIPNTGGGTPTASGATATMLPAATPSGPASLMVGQTASLGSFLTDGNGMTLYIFTKDQPGMSNCTGGCTTLWPPLLTNGTPVAGSGVNSSMIGTITRPDGTTQVTYNGWPLYYSSKDETSGDTNGEGYATFWFVITPAGTQR